MPQSMEIQYSRANIKGDMSNFISNYFFVQNPVVILKVREGRRHVIWASCTKTVISRLIHKISKHMIYQKIAYLQAF